MRKYFIKRVGWHWEIWFRRDDHSQDPANDAFEWKALWKAKFWRRNLAMWVAQEMQVAFNDGMFIQRCIDEDAIKLQVSEAMRK